MSALKINLNPLHIVEAEELFIKGSKFDPERLDFINSMDTIDLLAVPGSGKTTVLLAKLYCIAKQLPLENGSGILVLSHTNNAVEEIEKKLKPICPKLFEYPNFVGTVQSFANRFIANQACYNFYGSYIKKNDNEIFHKEVDKFYNGLRWSPKGKEPKNLRNKLVGIVNVGKQTSSFDECENNVIDFLKNSEFDLESRKIKIGKQTKFTYSGKNREYYVELENWRKGLLSKGILSFNDTFSISKRFLDGSSSQNLKAILQKRFSIVFVDEMQDLNKDQIDLVETIFFAQSSTSQIQRIGDKNQSIYSGTSSLSSDILWKTRNEIDPIRFPQNLSLQKSHRLTPTIANLVDCFVLNRYPNYKVDGTVKDYDIPPQLIIYKDENDGPKLKKKFISLIKKNKLDQSQINIVRGFHIIGWTTEKESLSDKWHLKKVFPEYTKESTQKKEDYDCLRKYFYLYDKEKNTLESIRKSLLNGITRILRIENIYFDEENKIHYRKSSLMNLIKNSGNEFYEQFNKKLFYWSFSIVTKKNYNGIYFDYCKFLKYDLGKVIPNFRIEKSIAFINQKYDQENQSTPVHNTTELENMIKMSSVHAVKGQTHCATMYLETEYFDFESNKLTVQLKPATKKKKAVFANNPLLFKDQNFSHLNKVRANETDYSEKSIPVVPK